MNECWCGGWKWGSLEYVGVVFRLNTEKWGKFIQNEAEWKWKDVDLIKNGVVCWF